MRETWYVMEDGSAGDPREIKRGKDGKLAHEDGRAVAYAAHGPRTRGVDLDPDGKPGSSEAPSPAKQMKPAKPKGGYKTRESKAD